MKQYPNMPYWVDEYGKFYREGKSTPLKEDINEGGYRRVTMSSGGKTKRVWVHRTVAELFLGNPENLPYVLHGDNDPSNNHYSNLRWGTHQENMLQCHQDGRCSNLTASDKAKETINARTRQRFETLLGDRLVSIEFGFRTYITYICKDCDKQYRSRTDSNVFKRGGDCRRCGMRKDEDIVSSA